MNVELDPDKKRILVTLTEANLTALQGMVGADQGLVSQNRTGKFTLIVKAVKHD